MNVVQINLQEIIARLDLSALPKLEGKPVTPDWGFSHWGYSDAPSFYELTGHLFVPLVRHYKNGWNSPTFYLSCRVMPEMSTDAIITALMASFDRQAEREGLH